MNKQLLQRAAELIKQNHTAYDGNNHVYKISFADSNAIPIHFKTEIDTFDLVRGLSYREGTSTIYFYLRHAKRPQGSSWLFYNTSDNIIPFFPDDVLEEIVQALENRFAKRNIFAV